MEQLDQGAVKLAQAIRHVESGGNFSARGKSGEYGAYQFMPSSLKAWSKQYLGREVTNPTPQEQNEIAYRKIKELKDKGYKPDQVAAIWNSGKPDYQNNRGTNSFGVAYDVPLYVSKVKSAYLSQAGSNVNGQDQPQDQGAMPNGEDTTRTPEPKKQSFISKLGYGIAKPFVKLGLSAAKAISPNRDLSKAGQTLQDQYTSKNYDVNIDSVKEGVGTGLEALATLYGGEAVGGVGKTAVEQTLKGTAKEALKRGLVQGAKEGAIAGGVAGAGSGLQEKNRNYGGAIVEGVKGAAEGALFGGLMGGTVPAIAEGTKGAREVVSAAKGTSTKTSSKLNKLAESIQLRKTKFNKPDIRAGAKRESFSKYGLFGDNETVATKAQDEITKRLKLTESIRKNPAFSNIKVSGDTLYKNLLATIENSGDTLGNTKKIAVAKQIAKDLMSKYKVNDLRKIKLDLPELYKLQQQAGDLTEFVYGQSVDDTATKAVYGHLYDILRKKNYGISNSTGLGEINKEISELIPIRKAALRNLPAEQRNAVLSLSDMLGLGASFASGHVAPLAVSTLQRASRSGRVARALSGLAERSSRKLPKQQFAKVNNEVIADLARKVKARGR